MNQVSTRKYAALLVSKESSILGQVEKKIKEEFDLEVYLFSEHDLRDTLRIAKPLLIIWDGREYSQKWHYLVQWLREHFHGCPLIALLETEESLYKMELYKLGINLIVNKSSNTFQDDLSMLIRAIIADVKTDEQNLMNFSFKR